MKRKSSEVLHSQTFQKLSPLGGYTIFCWKGGINLKRVGGAGGDVEMGVASFLLLYSAIQSHLTCVCGFGSSVF